VAGKGFTRSRLMARAGSGAGFISSICLLAMTEQSGHDRHDDEATKVSGLAVSSRFSRGRLQHARARPARRLCRVADLDEAERFGRGSILDRGAAGREQLSALTNRR